MDDWIKGEGPHSEIVISSRVRLARNIAGLPFPDRLNEQGAQRLITTVEKAIKRNPVLFKDFDLNILKGMTPLETRILVEKHLISPALAERHDQGAVFISKNRQMSIMVNEEDHIRIQVLLPGLQLDNAWDLANKIDDVLEETIDFAYDERYGYLTACPTNTGTGMRASVMVHLPALALTNQLKRVFQALGQLGLAVRGLYGEGTDIVGNMVQISNQLTLGQSEQHIIKSLKGVTGEIINKENQAREAMLKNSRIALEDKICRAYGILTEARIISSKEFMELLSDVRLGVDTGILKGIDRAVLNELMLESQPAFLQSIAGAQLNDSERDVFRAQLIRRKMK
ncbi:MAG: putative ATP:guanido phosphotransferase YacI [Firmicutes bacterium]|nr:putative ATP:guanido phosphotransferase YacI [Bacillota bacterium]